MIDALLLGISGTVPLPGRPLSALLLRLGPDLILFDCGEGTQVSMRRWGWGFKALSTICLSHLHADHVARPAPGCSTRLRRLVGKRRSPSLAHPARNWWSTA